MTVVGAGFISGSAGAAVIVLYALANLRGRRRGLRASWLVGAILGTLGMTLMAAGWVALAVAGPHLDAPLLSGVGLLVSLTAAALYLLSAAQVGRLRGRSRYSLVLRTDGVYRLVRHPQALALCLLAVGIGLFSLSEAFLLSLPLWVGFWVVYTFLEERFELIPAHGEEYLEYRRSTPGLLPTITSWKAFRAERRRLAKGSPAGPSGKEGSGRRDNVEQ